MLIIIRGLPGSGKTTKAKSLPPDIVHLETDQFWTDAEGNYSFDVSRLAEAHSWCLRETRKYLQQHRTVAVSNTFTTLGEMEQYIRLAIDFQCGLIVHNCEFQFESVHPVPKDVLKRMKDRWDPLDNIRSLPFSIAGQLFIPGNMDPYEMLMVEAGEILKTESGVLMSPVPSGTLINVLEPTLRCGQRILIQIQGAFTVKDAKQILSALMDAINYASVVSPLVSNATELPESQKTKEPKETKETGEPQ